MPALVPKLIVSPGSVTAMTHELVEEVMTIGRAPENTLRIDDPSVSGRHAELRQMGETFQLTDLKSTNGTRVNERPVESVTLRAGDRIRFGKVEARFEDDAAAGSEPLPVIAEATAQPAEMSARPADFANASPFARRERQRDPVPTAFFAVAAVAILAFIGSMIALLQMRPPAP
ncbi:MAG: FHA domain-containing protein [Verrucomicrobiota bacterium]|nr:FHA domain-containing protein [Verrucomicrobiota bacterium]